MAAIGEGWCFFANGVSYVAVIAGLLLMACRPRGRRARAVRPMASIVGGLPLRQATTRPIRALLLLLGVVSLTGMPYTVLMPIFADQILHGGRARTRPAHGRLGRRRAGWAADARREAASIRGWAAGWPSPPRASASA